MCQNKQFIQDTKDDNNQVLFSCISCGASKLWVWLTLGVMLEVVLLVPVSIVSLMSMACRFA